MKVNKFMSGSLGKMGRSQPYGLHIKVMQAFRSSMLYVAEKLAVVSINLLLPCSVHLKGFLTANTLFFFLTQWPRSSTDKGFEQV